MKKLSKSTLLLSCVAVVLLGTVVVMAVMLLKQPAQPAQPVQASQPQAVNSLPAADPNVITQMSPEEAAALLKKQQEEAAQNKIIVSMPSVITFKNADTAGKVSIENVTENKRAFTVTLVVTATGEEILKTGLIKPGEALNEAKLEVKLPKGSYDVAAMYTAYDLETNEEKGNVGVAITVVVQE